LRDDAYRREPEVALHFILKPPLSYVHGTDLVIFGVLMAVQFISESLIAHLRRAEHGDRIDDRGSLRRFATVLPLAWLVAFLLAVVPWTFFGNLALFRAGLAVIVAGLLLRWWSLATLGRLFTVNVAIRHEHRLIDSGPYRYVRHPAYTAIALVYLGTGLCLGNALSLVALVVPLLATLMYRMRVEEDVLVSGLGPVYRDYMTRTKRLIPGIY
jgi:protein-S-isoprenylcysteine O-methyltransferase